MPRMKALKSFYGDEGQIERGREFEASPGNVQAYEDRSLAVSVGGKSDSSRSTKVEQPLQNKAADAGPLPSAGGETGAAPARSSSPPVRARPGRGSKK